MPTAKASAKATNTRFPSSGGIVSFSLKHNRINTHKGRKLKIVLIVRFLNLLKYQMKTVLSTTIRITGIKKTTKYIIMALMSPCSDLFARMSLLQGKVVGQLKKRS